MIPSVTSPSRILEWALLLGLTLGLTPGVARADYLVASGDVLDVTVFRVPELSHEVRVDVDGKIAFPPLGRVDVTGQTVDAVAALLRDALAQGQILSEPRVTVALAETRPLFIGGDVATPGAYPYQVGLTVRRALALAGGLGFSRTRGAEEAATLRRERDAATIDLLRQRARLERVTAELDGAESFEPAVPAEGVAKAARAEILALEARRFASDRAETEAEKAHLARDADLARARIGALADERELQRRLAERQTDEIARIRDIQARGLVSQARVTEEQRVLDSVQERAAANETEMAAAREGLETATHALDRFDDRWRAALEAEKQEALLAIETGATGLRAIERRLAELGVSDLGRIRIAVYRAGDTDPAGTPADYGTELAPGDTLEITLEMDGAPEEPEAEAVPPAPGPSPAALPEPEAKPASEPAPPAAALETEIGVRP